MTPHLTTRRLHLRPLTIADADPLQQIFIEPGVRRFLWDDEIVSKDAVSEMLESNEKLFAQERRGLWGASLRQEESSLIGFVGLWEFHEPPQTELVVGLRESWWRRGLALEMCRCLIDYAFAELGAEEILASADSPHQASIGLMNKLGMTWWKSAPSAGRQTSFYRRHRDQTTDPSDGR